MAREPSVQNGPTLLSAGERVGRGTDSSFTCGRMVDLSEDRANSARGERPLPARPKQEQTGPMELDIALEMFCKDYPILEATKPSGD